LWQEDLRHGANVAALEQQKRARASLARVPEVLAETAKREQPVVKTAHAKGELLLWAARNFLPAVNKKGPTIWAVYCAVVSLSPEDLRAFKVPSRQLAEAAGVSTGSLPGAVNNLHAQCRADSDLALDPDLAPV